MKRRIINFIFIAIIIIAAGCEKEVTSLDEPADVIADYTALSVNSNPSGATIYVNDKNSGYKTPCKIKWIEKGNIKVTFKLPFYIDSTVTISANSSITSCYYDFYSDSRNFGSITCTTYPSGADIYLNGSNLGKKTPFKITSLRPAKYLVKFKYPNCRSDSGNVTVSAAEVSQIGLKLVDTSSFVDYSREIKSTYGDCVFIDRQNRLWYGSEDKGFFVYANNTFVNYNTQNSPLPGIYINLIFEDSKQNMWISTNGGLAKLSVTGNWEIFTKTNSPLNVTTIDGICEDKDNNIWMATKYGLLKYKNGVWDLCTDENAAMLPGRATALGCSTDNSIWIANYNYGVSRYHNGTWEYFTPDNSKIPGLYLTGIYCGNDNTVYAYLYNGISKYYNGTWTLLSAGKNILTVFEDSDKSVWVSDDYSINIYKDNSSAIKVKTYDAYPDLMAKSIVQDKDKNIWFATYKYGLVRYKYNKSLQ